MTSSSPADDADWSPVTLIGRPLRDGLRPEVLHIAVGATLAWRPDRVRARCLATLEHGGVELVARTGARLRLEEGAVFWLPTEDLAAIRNVGVGAAVIATVRRTTSPSHEGAAPCR